MDRREKLLAEARRWIGTPYQHQASRRGVGCDCLGLVRGLWRQLNGQEPVAVPAYGPDWSEPSHEELLWKELARHMRSSSGTMKPGEIVLFRMRTGSVAKHLGILSQVEPHPKFIHAYSGHGVVENSLSQPWARRVVARFDMI